MFVPTHLPGVNQLGEEGSTAVEYVQFGSSAAWKVGLQHLRDVAALVLVKGKPVELEAVRSASDVEWSESAWEMVQLGQQLAEKLAGEGAAPCRRASRTSGRRSREGRR
jgi:hypothetical protein